jgi:endonuclease YncB( thermonuclease family)
MRSWFISAPLLLSLFTQTAGAETISGRPSRIISGDKLILTTTDNQQLEVQLLGIRVPAPTTKMGRAARKRLTTLVAGRPITVEYQIRNRWGHPLAKLLLGETDINLRLVQEGLAMHKPDFQTLKDNGLYSQAMQNAKKHGFGIWARAR